MILKIFEAASSRMTGNTLDSSERGRAGVSCVAVVVGHAPHLLTFRGDMIRQLVGRQHRVVALAPEIGISVRTVLGTIGVQSLSVPLSRGSFNPIRDVRSLLSMRARLRAAKPDILFAFTTKPVIWGTLAARAAGVKRIVPMITGVGFAFTEGREPKRRLARFVATILYRIALRHAHVVLFQNPDDMALFRKLRLMPKRVPSAVVNGSGVDIEHYAPLPLPDAPAFVMIARFLGDKGIREFAEAARILKARYIDTPIRLVGSLDLSPDSITQGELEGIVAAGVDLVGRLEDVRPAIAESSVFVLPSYREGTPRSTLEAMAMGRAVVTTDAPGCRETVIEGVNGYLVPPRDAVSLAAAMERFIVDPSLARRMGAESRRIVEERYDVNLVNAEIMRHAGLLDPVG